MVDHKIGDTPPSDTREALARLFDTSHTNITWAIRNGPKYPEDFDAAQTFQHLSPYAAFLTSIENGLQTVYDEGRNARTQLEEAQQRIKALEPRIQQYEQQTSTYTETIKSLSSQNATLTQILASKSTNPATDFPFPTALRKKKREAKDPTPFDGKGSPTEKQEKFEIWETKIQGVFERDAKSFETPTEEILYMSDMLTDKAYDYVKHGLDMRRLHPGDPSKWIFSDRESMLEYMRKHYKTIDTTQVAKNKLDTLTQGERNYWSWKAELDELMIKANKTEEQKVDLLKKNVSSKIKDLVLTLSHKLGDADYKGWSDQMDVFAQNLQNHAHQAKLKPNTTNGYRPHNNNTPAPAPSDDLMDLDAARLGGLSDDVRQYRKDNQLCMACGQSGHWKSAHDPAKTNNPLPLPPRQLTHQPDRGGFFSRGGANRGGTRGRGRGFSYDGPPPRFPPAQPQQMVPYAGYGQTIRAADYESGYVIGEAPSSTYTSSETGTPSQASRAQSRQRSPPPQSSKGQPLD